MNMGKKTSWQVVAIAAAAMLSGAAQADGRDHRGRGDDRGWRDHNRHYDSRHDRGWHHGKHHRSHRHGARARHWVPLPPPPHWRHSPRHRHYYDSYYRSNYWVPDRGGVRVVIGLPLY